MTRTVREQMAEALEECQRLAIERVKTADAAVKRDVYAADALMGIATVARRALDRHRAEPEKVQPCDMCDGSGKIGGIECRRCLGTGVAA